jgi:hypothetical protein
MTARERLALMRLRELEREWPDSLTILTGGVMGLRVVRTKDLSTTEPFLCEPVEDFPGFSADGGDR